MVRESEGLVDIRVVASRRTFFQYTFTVTSMDIIATSKLNGVCVSTKVVLHYTPYPFSAQTTLTMSIQPLHIHLDLLMTMNQSHHLS